MTGTLRTISHVLDERATDDRTSLLFEDSCWTWREFVAESVLRANLLVDTQDPDREFHVAVMLENEPEYLFMIAAAAYAGAAVVGINLTVRGEELADQIRYTDCSLLITDSTLVKLLDGLDVGIDPSRVLVIDSPEYQELLDSYQGRPVPQMPAARDPQTNLLLIFTSGSTGRPKAVVCTTGRLAWITGASPGKLGPEDVSYNAMPLFHGNAIMACWANPLGVGGTFALAKKFSASRFVDDLLKFKATYFNYVGRSLAYILAQPERPEEKQTQLKFAFGTEASQLDRDEFTRRFGVTPTESYGSSEGVVSIAKAPGTPEAALGLAMPGMPAIIVDPETMQECPRVEFDDQGQILNAEEAIGEIAGPEGVGRFEGYYKDPEATEQRIRGDVFLTGDLGYRDAEGYFYFAGRGGDRIRVDSENFSAAPVERILSRYPKITLVAVYPVPDERTGDQVMATLQVKDPEAFSTAEFEDFLDAQPDLGTKWVPKYLRLVTDVPITATRKINKPVLRKEAWEVDDLLYYRPAAPTKFAPLTEDEKARIRDSFMTNGRMSFVPARKVSI